MTNREILNLDPSFNLIVGELEGFELKRISSYLKPEANTFVFLKNKKYMQNIGRLSKHNQFQTTGLVLDEKFTTTLAKETVEELKAQFAWLATIKDISRGMCIYSKYFYDCLYGELNYYVDGRQVGNCKIHPNTFIAQNVFIGENVEIEEGARILPGSVIMPMTKIGKHTTIFPNVTIYPYSTIGNNCRIHASTVIGGDGFGYNFYDGEHNKIWHLAGVVIEDNVEIGGATMVDCGAFIETRVGEGTKLDNFCQISHNAQIGKHCVFAGKAGSSGSGEVGDFCAFGAGAGLAPGAQLGAFSQLAAHSVVSENSVWPQKSILAGHPARPLKEWLKSQAKLRSLLD